MTYSRWSDGSGWYCRWSSFSPKTTFRLPTRMLKNSQLFEIYDSPKYFITYGDIKDKGISLVLDEIRSYYKHKRPSEQHMMCMMEYVSKFVNDVDNHFKPTTFFKYEWIYPIFKNK
jgi:hypothetical protein